MAATTCSGVRSTMHLKWPSGHSRLKQGLHGRSSFRMRASGDERRGKGRAARAVKRDERLSERRRHVHEAGIVAHDEPRRGEHIDRLGEVVRPQRSRHCARTQARRSRRRSPHRWRSRPARRRSPGSRAAARALRNRRAGQRFAGPYSAPGHNAATGRSACRARAAQALRAAVSRPRATPGSGQAGLAAHSPRASASAA